MWDKVAIQRVYTYVVKKFSFGSKPGSFFIFHLRVRIFEMVHAGLKKLRVPAMRI